MLSLFLLISFFFIQAHPATAAKPKKVAVPSFSISAQYIKPPKNLVRMYFGNLKGIAKVSYTLMYTANGVGQGVEGSFSPGKKTSWSKDLFLGTCSGKVCLRHGNIKNMQLEVITKFTNGKSAKKIIKPK